MGDAAKSDGSGNEFTGGRYERLQQAADMLALDPALADTEVPFNADGLRCLVGAIVSHGIFDSLTQRDVDVVTMLLVLDYHYGPLQVASRIQGLLSGSGAELPPGANPWAVVSGLAAVLALMADTLARLPATAGDLN